MSYELLTGLGVERAQWKNRIHGVAPLPDNLKFSEAWATHGFKWCGGKFFQITRSMVVPYSLSYILPNADYKDVDLSNSTDGAKLYPEAEGRVYEMLVGLKPGNFLCTLYIPTGKYLHALGYSTMYPDPSDTERRYLGGFKPEDSPADSPNIKLWAIKEYDPWNLRLYVLDGVGFEKVGVELLIAKHDLTELTEEPEHFTLIKHHTEIEGTW
jgi:hypothetical protein